MVAIVALIVAALYLMAVPVRLGVAVKTDRAEPVRLGVSLLGLRLAYAGRFVRREGVDLVAVLSRRAGKAEREVGLRDLIARAQTAGAGASAAKRALKYLARKTKLVRLSVDMNVHLPDAGHTALLYGAAIGAAQAVRRIKPSLPLRAHIRADFGGAQFWLGAVGIASIPLGHIIIAALIAALDYAQGRHRLWTSTRSNPS
ncbi:MAG: hypothetical protein GX558_04385 [Clostridiales bacterium]|nr:hypothetical protein [Clostridiales bacterium]